jgi:TonB-dependent starch-binding outer membrane protein SusC
MDKKCKKQSQFVKLMKFTFIQLCLIALSTTIILAHDMKAQAVLNQAISLKVENQSLKSTVKTLEKVASVNFTYRKGLSNMDKKVTLDAQNEKLSSVLSRVFENTGIQYEVLGNQIVLTQSSKMSNVTPSVSEPKKEVLSATTPFVIEGEVINEQNEPLIGASVVVRGTTKGTVTGDDGKYKLTVTTEDKKKVLVFSFVGHQTLEEPIKSRNIVNVILKEGEALSEVVVVGYGSMKKSDLTGAVTTIKTKASDATQFNSVDGLMRGRAAGVQVVQAGGDPGGAISVKIRGVNSLRGDNEPLYVVDGVIMNNVTSDNNDPFASKTANSGQSAQSGLTGINPQDIESIEVLKDASATAIYGSRGANGVVMITTKQGKGKPTATFTSTLEMARASKKLNMLDAKGYGKYINDIEVLNGRVAKFGLDTLQNADWQSELQRTSIRHNNRLTVSGSSKDDKTKYYFAAGYLGNEGIVKNSALNQGDLKINFSQDFSSRLKFNLTLSGIANENLMALSTEPLGGGDNSFIVKMLVGSPIRNSVVDNTDPSTPYDNPLSWLKDYEDIANEKRILSGIGLVYKINDVFSYKLALAGDYRTKERKRWFGKTTFSGKNANGSLGLSQYDRTFYQVENLLLFKKKIQSNSKLDGVIGVTYDNENIKRSSVINENFFTEDLRTEGFGFGQLIYPFLRDRTGVEVFSTLARATYNVNEKYLLTVSGRADGTSKFSRDNKFSFFPAAALAWRVSEESFLKNSKLINSLKFRVGYGRSGNQAIAPYGTFARYGQVNAVSGNTVLVGSVPTNIQNNNLKWETTDQFNSGIDFSILRDRLTGTVDAYYKKTYDLLQVFNLPTSAGFGTVLKNIGTVENKGIELSLTGHIIRRGAMNLNLSGNIAFNRNQILDLGLPEAKFGTYNWEAYIGGKVSNGTFFKDPANVFVVGQPIGLFYGYQTNGVFQTGEDISKVKQFGTAVLPGDLKIVDVNKDGDINPDDKVIIGNPNPKFVYGFNSSFNYGNFNFDVFFNGVYGNQIVNGSLFRIGNPNGNNLSNILASTYEGAWTAANQTNNPRVGYNNLNLIDRYVEDGSFLRLATTTLGYNFLFKKKTGIRSLTVNLIGKNLFTFTKYSGFDPEVNSFSFDGGKIGIDWGSYPNLRSVSLGFNIVF